MNNISYHVVCWGEMCFNGFHTFTVHWMMVFFHMHLFLLFRLGKGRRWMRNITNVCLTPWTVSSRSPMNAFNFTWRSAWLRWRTRYEFNHTNLYILHPLYTIIVRGGNHKQFTLHWVLSPNPRNRFHYSMVRIWKWIGSLCPTPNIKWCFKLFHTPTVNPLASSYTELITDWFPRPNVSRSQIYMAECPCLHLCIHPGERQAFL